MSHNDLKKLVVGIKGAGEMATGVAWRLFLSNIRKIFLLEIPFPLAVRRNVSFCEAIHERTKTVEGVEAIKAIGMKEIHHAWDLGKIPVIVDPHGSIIGDIRPDVLVDATLAKRNLGTSRHDAPHVIALGPGFEAGNDVHMVVETNRGHNLGKVITAGRAELNTGIPGNMGGYTRERVLRAPVAGVFTAHRNIGERVSRGKIVGAIDEFDIKAEIDGIIRGLIRSGTQVTKGLKLGDIDPRAVSSNCYTISDKARAIGGAVLEAILRVQNI